MLKSARGFAYFTCSSVLLLLLIGAPISVHSQQSNLDQQKIEELIASCRNLQRPDDICRVLVSLKTIGNDAIEAIKEFVDLTPEQYWALTAANAIATSKVRIKTNLNRKKQIDLITDLRKDVITLTVEYQF